MTHPTTARQVFDANTLATLGRVIRFLQDPAVHNVWSEAGSECAKAGDTVGKAVGSIRRASSESAAVWRRHGGEDSSAD